ncbi:MAG: hypothetical protein ABGX15_05875, partial [Paracoccaceae bacterium]
PHLPGSGQRIDAGRPRRTWSVTMYKSEIEFERNKNARAWRRAQMLEIAVGLVVCVWVLSKFSMAI